jgi:hypothetical protein
MATQENQRLEHEFRLNRRTILEGCGAGCIRKFVTHAGYRLRNHLTWPIPCVLSQTLSRNLCKGRRGLAKSIGAKQKLWPPKETLKRASRHQALLQRTGGKLILNVDPNDHLTRGLSWRK